MFYDAEQQQKTKTPLISSIKFYHNLLNCVRLYFIHKNVPRDDRFERIFKRNSSVHSGEIKALKLIIDAY